MCNEQHRLIGYLYDEGDAGERAIVEKHLAECEACRAEVNGLRGVRTELLAWEVPARASVWTPFAAERVVPWYRQVPAWGLAAAAGVMFAIGLTGGVAAHAIFPGVAQQAAPTLAAVPASPSTLTAFDPKVLEQNIYSRVRAEFASNRQTPVRVLTTADVVQQAQGLVKASEQRQRAELDSRVYTLLHEKDAQWKADQRTINQLKSDLAILKMRLDAAQVGGQNNNPGKQ